MNFLTAIIVAQLASGDTPTAESHDGGVSGPRIVRKLDGTYNINQAAFDTIDLELRRLQNLERTHKDENWVGVVLTGMVIGLIIGAGAVGAVWGTIEFRRQWPGP